MFEAPAGRYMEQQMYIQQQIEQQRQLDLERAKKTASHSDTFAPDQASGFVQPTALGNSGFRV